MTKPTAAIVIPALNEEATIADLLAEIQAVANAPDLPVQITGIFVVDNGSTDATAAQAKDAGATVVSEPRQGYGRACLSGVLATGEVDLIVLMDGDRSDCPDELGLLLAPLLAERADLIIGSRVLGNAEPESLTTPQRAGNRIASLLLRVLFGVRVTDIGPFRVVRKRDLLALGMREMTYGWSVEMIARASQAGLRVAEVPVSYRKRAGGASKVSGNVQASIKAGYRIVGSILRCRLTNIRTFGAPTFPKLKHGANLDEASPRLSTTASQYVPQAQSRRDFVEISPGLQSGEPRGEDA